MAIHRLIRLPTSLSPAKTTRMTASPPGSFWSYSWLSVFPYLSACISPIARHRNNNRRRISHGVLPPHRYQFHRGFPVTNSFADGTGERKKNFLQLPTIGSIRRLMERIAGTVRGLFADKDTFQCEGNLPREIGGVKKRTYPSIQIISRSFIHITPDKHRKKRIIRTT